MVLDKSTVDFLVNHVILPPKLPQERESEDDEIKGEKDLLELVIHTITKYVGQTSGRSTTAWRYARSAIEAGSTLCKKTLVEMFSDLGKAGQLITIQCPCISKSSGTNRTTAPVVLYIKAQNCCLLIRKTQEDNFIFSAFETSAESSAVIQSEARLQWTFPGRSVIAPHSAFKDKKLAEELAGTIQLLQQERVGLMIGEGDSAHPGLVTEVLQSIVAKFGDNCECPRIHKKIRDEVNWNGNRLPWRRSPLWLVIRVSLNLLLRDILSPQLAEKQYKNFMAFFIAKVSDAAKDFVDPDIKAVINAKLARRLTKLDGNILSFVSTAVKDTASNYNDSLDAS